MIHSWNGGHFSKDSCAGLLTFLSPWHTGQKYIVFKQKKKKKRKKFDKRSAALNWGQKTLNWKVWLVRALQGTHFNKCFRWNSTCPSLPLTPFPFLASRLTLQNEMWKDYKIILQLPTKCAKNISQVSSPQQNKEENLKNISTKGPSEQRWWFFSNLQMEKNIQLCTLPWFIRNTLCVCVCVCIIFVSNQCCSLPFPWHSNQAGTSQSCMRGFGKKRWQGCKLKLSHCCKTVSEIGRTWGCITQSHPYTLKTAYIHC